GRARPPRPPGRRRRPWRLPCRAAVVRLLPTVSAALQAEVLPQPLGLRPTDRNLRRLRVFHPEDVIPAEPGDYLLDLVNVNQMRPVHAPEHARVQPRLQLVERPEIGRPRKLVGYYVNRVVGQGRIDYLVGLDEQKPLTHLHRHAFALVLPLRHQLDDAFHLVVQRRFADPPPRALHRLLQPGGIHWL